MKTRFSQRLKSGLKDALHRRGIEVHRTAYLEHLDRREQRAVERLTAVITEFEAFARDTGFPSLPARANRVRLLRQLGGTETLEALYMIDAVHRSLACLGDICEFGVAAGATSALIANEIFDTEKRLWLFDSFEGLPRPTPADVLLDDMYCLGEIAAYEGTMAVPMEFLLSRLAQTEMPRERVTIVKGFIEDIVTSAAELPAQVCFAYVDFDFYEPIKVALAMLAGRVSVGGRIMVDDYGFFSRGAQTAVDEFVNEAQGTYQLEVAPADHGHFAILTRI